ncbi:MFS transporter [Chloroflexota bacterium]
MPKKQITQLVLFVFVDVIGYSLFFPLLPYYAAEFGAGASLVGFMIASNAGAQLLVAPLVGRLSDRFGRRPLIMVSIIGTILSFFLLALVEPVSNFLSQNLNVFWGDQLLVTRRAGWAIIVLFFCRILDGAAGGNVSLARAYVSDITSKEHRAQGLGLIGAAFGFGFILGPAIGGTLSNWGAAIAWMEQLNLSRFAIPALAAVAISLVNLIGVFFFLPESLPKNLRTSTTVKNEDDNGLPTRRRQLPDKLIRLLGLRFLFSLAITLFMANFALFTQNHLALSDQATSYLLTYAGILLILVQAVGIRWLTRRYPERSINFYSAFIVTASLLALSLASDIWTLMLIIFPLAISGGTMNTIVNSLISKSVEKNQAGGALGLATSLESLAWVFAPIIGGALIDFYGGIVFAVVAGFFAGLMIPYIKLFLNQDTNGETNIQN